MSFNRSGLDDASRPKRIGCVPDVMLRKLGRSRFSACFQERWAGTPTTDPPVVAAIPSGPLRDIGLIRARAVNPAATTKDTAMVRSTEDFELEASEHLHAMAQAVIAGRRAEQARQSAEAARRLAADSVHAAAASLALSAGSQERTAQAFEDAADRGGRLGEFFRVHAVDHRRFAAEDRRMAQELRQNGRAWLAVQSHLGR